jgi:conjugal transfer pilus assembly protein TraV
MMRGIVLCAGAAVLSGCASGLSGIGGSASYSCSAPEGVSCMSVTGLHANVTNGTLPALQPPQNAVSTPAKEAGPEAGKAGSAVPVSPQLTQAPYSGQPIRTPARVLRVWMAPFEDTDADLHDQKYLYVTVHTGRWMLEANQMAVQRQYRQVFPLTRSQPESKQSTPAAGAARSTGALAGAGLPSGGGAQKER